MLPEHGPANERDLAGVDLEPRLKNRTIANSEVDALKQRLKTFWNMQQEYWDMLSSSDSLESPSRQRAAEFLLPGESVLDVACGTAANSVWIGKRCRYFGVDLSIKALQQKVNPSLRLACGDADSLPFRSESFDAAVATYVLEHAVEPIKTLQETCRVVRPGGRIVLLGPAWDFPFWFPNSLRSRSRNHWWRLRYSLGRFWRQLMGWWFGRLPFERIIEPDAFNSKFIHDADAVYIVWTYEVVRLMARWGHRLLHWEVDDQMLGTTSIVRSFKRILTRIPMYRYSGSTVLLVFEK
jgi:SAM-dependent methyltransferase